MGWFNKKSNADTLPDFWKAYAEHFQNKPSKTIAETRFVVWDTETTGFHPETDRILCIGAVSLINKQIAVKDSFEVFLKQNYYNAKSAPIHGILKREKHNCITEEQAIIQFLGYIKDAVLVGHHVGFDVKMLNTALHRHQLPSLKNKTLDTGMLYKNTLLATSMLKKKEQYTLDELAEKFNISQKDRHTALGDSLITAMVFLDILERFKLNHLRDLFKKQTPRRSPFW
ncbi:MAG: 3'-5' exonuclease [Bacteroidota bacterium]